MATDSPVATAFVVAPDHWSRNGAGIRAIVCHMAEGGGTVPWLTRNDGNSAHYVVEYRGRVVQMVAESRAAGSMNPNLTRTTDDAPYTFEGERVVYGRTALNAAGIASDPNRYAIAIEVEGYAADGPNAAQRAQLAHLIADIRRRRGALPVLGHRDQQRYKACPGKKFPWADYGGHAVKTTVTTPPDTSTGDVVKSFRVPENRTFATVPDGTWLYDNSALAASAANVRLSPGRDLVYVGVYTEGVRIVAYEPVVADANTSSVAMFVKADQVTLKAAPLPIPDPAALADAKAAGYADAKAKAIAAVSGI